MSRQSHEEYLGMRITTSIYIILVYSYLLTDKPKKIVIPCRRRFAAWLASKIVTLFVERPVCPKLVATKIKWEESVETTKPNTTTATTILLARLHRLVYRNKHGTNNSKEKLRLDVSERNERRERKERNFSLEKHSVAKKSKT